MKAGKGLTAVSGGFVGATADSFRRPTKEQESTHNPRRSNKKANRRDQIAKNGDVRRNNGFPTEFTRQAGDEAGTET